jgi:hypothetical protein
LKVIKVFISIILLSYFYDLLLVISHVDKSYVYQLVIVFGLIVLLSIAKSLSRLSIVFILLNLIPFVLSCEKLGFLEGLAYFLTTGLLPVIFYEAIRRNFSQEAFDFVMYYILFKYSLYIVLIPVEVRLNAKMNWAGLQFSGGQYNSIAILILTLIIMYVGRSLGLKIKGFFIYFAKVLFLATVLLSFSRGGLVVGCIVLLAEIRRSNVKNIFKAFILFSGAYIMLQDAITIDNSFTLKFWLQRLDIYNNVTGETNFSTSSIIDTYRSSSRDVFYEFFSGRNVIDIIFGSGIGTSTYIINEGSKGKFGFGSFHNLFLTIFMERGLLFLTFFTGLFLSRISKMIRVIKEHRYRLFLYALALLLFATSTGFELFVNSRDFNVDFIILLFTFIYLINYYVGNKNEFSRT